MKKDYIWHPIERLTKNEMETFGGWEEPQNNWIQDSKKWKIEDEGKYKKIISILNRRFIIHNGKIENFYKFSTEEEKDRGITETIIENGIREAGDCLENLELEEKTNLRILMSEESPLTEILINALKNKRDLSISLIRELHAAVMIGVKYYKATDLLGKETKRKLEYGKWKTYPNSPITKDGSKHEYCSPEQVNIQIDEFINLANEYDSLVKKNKLNPILLAAFVHHRFSQIHPFPDGNGRVARVVMNYFLIKYGLLNITIPKDSRGYYYDSLKEADTKDIVTFANFLNKLERIQIEDFYEKWSKPTIDTENEDGLIMETLGSSVYKFKEQQTITQNKELNNKTAVLQDIASKWMNDYGGKFSKSAGITKSNAHTGADSDHYFYSKEIIGSVNNFPSGYFVRDSKNNRYVSCDFFVGNKKFCFVVSFHEVGRQNFMRGITIFSKIKETKDIDKNNDNKFEETIFYMKEPFLFTSGDKHLEEGFSRLLSKHFKSAMVDLSILIRDTYIS